MRIATHRFIAAFSILAAALTVGALSQNVVAQEATSPDESLKQIALTDAHEYHDVAENIGLVMSGIDPDTKKYVGPDAVIKKHIAFIDSENLAANDKKRQLEELQSKLKSLPEPVKFPANIDLVVKNYDKINAAMPPVQ